MNDGGDNYGGLLGMMNDGGGNTPGMGGLLGGFFDDPRKMAQLAAFGQALAQASAKNPGNRGAALAGGMSGAIDGGYQFDQRAMQQQMQDLQQRKATEDVRKAKTLNDLAAKALGQQGQQDMPPQPAAFPPMAEMGGGMPQGSPPQGQAGAFHPGSMFNLAQAFAIGKEDPTALMNITKMMQEGVKRDPGAIYRNVMTGKEEFTPNIPPGLDYNPNTRAVSGLSGFNQANAAMKGAETGATEAAKAPYNFVDVPQSDGTTRKMRSDLASSALGGQPSPPPGIPQQVWDTYKSGKDFTAQVGPDGRTSVQTGSQLGVSANPVKLASDKVYQENTAKDSAEMYKNLQTSGMKAPGLISKYQRVGELLDGVNGNKLSPTGLEVAKFAKSAGFDVDPKMGNKEAAASIANMLALSLRDPSSGGGMPGAMSDADRQFLMNSVPGLVNSDAGRKAMIDMQVKIHQREIEVAQKARAWQQRYGRIDAPAPDGKDFMTLLQSWADSNPLFK